MPRVPVVSKPLARGGGCPPALVDKDEIGLQCDPEGNGGAFSGIERGHGRGRRFPTSQARSAIPEAF